MKKVVLAISLISQVFLYAAQWRGIDDERYISGPKLTPESLAGKVVIVDQWGVYCPPCRRLLPVMEEYYQAFKHKPFVIVGSHRQQADKATIKTLLDQNKVTFPVYSGFGLAVGEPDNGGGIPFIYVVDRLGEVVYSGRDSRAAIEAAICALSPGGVPDNLVEKLELDKFNSMAKKLVFGRSIKNELKKLEKEAAKKDSPAAREAKLILDEIEKVKSRIEKSLTVAISSEPIEAVTLINKYMKTWPEDGKKYVPLLSELKQKAKEEEKRIRDEERRARLFKRKNK